MIPPARVHVQRRTEAGELGETDGAIKCAVATSGEGRDKEFLEWFLTALQKLQSNEAKGK